MRHVPKLPQARAVAHRCPVTDCRTGCSSGHTVCRHHWTQIPEAERAVLRAAFRARTTFPARYAEAADLTVRLANHYARRAA